IAQDLAFRASPQLAASTALFGSGLSVLDRHVTEFTNTRQDRVARGRSTPHREHIVVSQAHWKFGSGSLDSPSVMCCRRSQLFDQFVGSRRLTGWRSRT